MSITVRSDASFQLAYCSKDIMKKATINVLSAIGMSLILGCGITTAMSMEDGLSPSSSRPAANKAKGKTKAEADTTDSAGYRDDQALSGNKQESLRPPVAPAGLVNPCQMADSPKWCEEK